jgi:hypothetical protein
MVICFLSTLVKDFVNMKMCVLVHKGYKGKICQSIMG